MHLGKYRYLHSFTVWFFQFFAMLNNVKWSLHYLLNDSLFSTCVRLYVDNWNWIKMPKSAFQTAFYQLQVLCVRETTKIFLLKHALHFNLIYNTKEELHLINKIEFFVANNWGQNLGEVTANWMKLRCKKVISEAAERKPLSWTFVFLFSPNLN